MSVLFDIRPGHTLDLAGLPGGTGQMIFRTLTHQLCTPDTALIIADALAEMRDFLGPTSHYFIHVERTEKAIRDMAPIFGASLDAPA